MKGVKQTRDVRSEVVDPSVAHVDGDVVLVRKRVRDSLDMVVLREDPFGHLVQSCL